MPEGANHSSRLWQGQGGEGSRGTVTIEKPLLPPSNFMRQLPCLTREQMGTLEHLYRSMRIMFQPHRIKGRPFVVHVSCKHGHSFIVVHMASVPAWFELQVTSEKKSETTPSNSSVCFQFPRAMRSHFLELVGFISGHPKYTWQRQVTAGPTRRDALPSS